MNEPIYQYVKGKGWIIGPNSIPAEDLQIGDTIIQAYRYGASALWACRYAITNVTEDPGYNTPYRSFWTRNYSSANGWTFEVKRG